MLSEQNQRTEVAAPNELEGVLISDDVDLLTSENLQPLPRGRSTHGNSMSRRPASSVSALDPLRTIVPYDSLRRTFRSASPRIITHPPVTSSISGTSDNTDPMDTSEDEDVDDVDFWGRQSPRERARHETEMVEAGSVDGSEEGEEDDKDELMDDELEDDEDDEEREEDERMEIFGHR